MDQPVAVITGAGRGIGRAAAVELVRVGFRLALASRNAAELNETARLAAGTDRERTLAVPTDVTRPDEVDRLVSAAADRLGRLDAVVHCAGIAPVRPIPQMSVEEW